MKPKIKSWDFNKNCKLKWLKSKNKEIKLMSSSKRSNMNHQLLKRNKPKLMKNKSKLMLKKMLLKNLPLNVKLLLKRLNPLLEKPKLQLNCSRKTISVKWRPLPVHLLVSSLPAELCWLFWKKRFQQVILMIKFGKKLKVWWINHKSSCKECWNSTVLTLNKVSWITLTRSSKTHQRNIQKRTWLDKVSLLLNCVPGQWTSLHSTESTKKSDHYKFQEIRLTNNWKQPWRIWLKLRKKSEN